MSGRRVKWLGLINLMLFYTFGFVLALFGSWTSTWLRPISAFTWCAMSGIWFELMIHNVFLLSDASQIELNNKSAFAEVAVVLGYMAVPLLVIWYRSFNNPLATAGDASLLQTIPVVLAVLIYALLMARAVVVYRKWLSTIAQH